MIIHQYDSDGCYISFVLFLQDILSQGSFASGVVEITIHII